MPIFRLPVLFGLFLNFVLDPDSEAPFGAEGCVCLFSQRGFGGFNAFVGGFSGVLVRDRGGAPVIESDPVGSSTESF